MKVTINYRELTNEQRRAALARPALRSGAWKIVKAGAFKLEREIKILMPKDTGRAAGSWGHSTPPASAADGIWIEDEPNLMISEGSTVEYIPALNEGHSKQRGAGFIDAEAVKVEAELNAAIDQLIRDTL